jgi:hypothetical protein
MASTKGIGLLCPALYRELCVNLSFADANELRVAFVTAQRIVETKDNDGQLRNRWRIEQKAADAKRRVAEVELLNAKERARRLAVEQQREIDYRNTQYATWRGSMRRTGGESDYR